MNDKYLKDIQEEEERIRTHCANNNLYIPEDKIKFLARKNIQPSKEDDGWK